MIKINDIMRVADIPSGCISAQLFEAMRTNQTYTDEVLKEHIYSIEDLVDKANDEESPWDRDLIRELDVLKISLDIKNLGYFRLIFE